MFWGTILVGTVTAYWVLRYLFCRLMYPKPLPGIPYIESSLDRILGDLPQIKSHSRMTKETTEGMFAVAKRLGSPIAQLIFPVFQSRRIVIVDDPREAEHILCHRHHEFDRSIVTSQFWLPLFPHSTIAQATTPKLKAQKRLWAGTMNTKFLDRVVAPNMWYASMELVDLWRLKAVASDGNAFDVAKDFSNAALDAIWVAVFGQPLGVLKRELHDLVMVLAKKQGIKPEMFDGEKYHTENMTATEKKRMENAAVVQQAVTYMNEIVLMGFRSFWPALTFSLLKLSPTYRRFKKVTYGKVKELMAQACQRYQREVMLFEAANSDVEGEYLDTCAMDLVLRRQILTAKKEGHPMGDPTKDQAMLEELLLLLLAGHESTAAALSWFTNLIALYPKVQRQLRRTLELAFCMDSAPSTPSTDAINKLFKLPSAAQILAAQIPYLDAVMYETLRFAPPTGAVVRQATVDTTILGCPIPKGTHVMLNTRIFYPPKKLETHGEQAEDVGLGFIGGMETAVRRRDVSVDKGPCGITKLSRSCTQGFELLRDSWSHLERFAPERWLVEKDSEVVFDANALPSLVFGGGYRGCFGRKLAMRELKIMITLLILSFEFLPIESGESILAGEERTFRRPKTCQVRLKQL